MYNLYEVWYIYLLLYTKLGMYILTWGWLHTTSLTSGVTLLHHNNTYFGHKYCISDKKNDPLTLFPYNNGTGVMTPQIRKGKNRKIDISLWLLLFKDNK